MQFPLMNTVQRREQIVDQLQEAGTVTVVQLSQQFGVSEVTIRNDLRQLEAKGCLIRSYGGAMLNTTFAFDRPLLDKTKISFTAKNNIARHATDLIQNGDRIILDSGSTTALMLPYLQSKKDLIVLTNALNIAYELATYNNIELLIAGGNVRRNAYSISGQVNEKLLQMYRFDKFFLGVDGFDLNAGITTPNFGEACLNRMMCDASQQVIAVTDSSKFGRESFCFIRKTNEIDLLITDSGIPPDYLETLQQQGVTVKIADQVPSKQKNRKSS